MMHVRLSEHDPPGSNCQAEPVAPIDVGKVALFFAISMTLPKGPKVVPFWNSYIEPYKEIPKRNFYGASG